MLGQNLSKSTPSGEPGEPFPFGATHFSEGINFAIFIKDAKKVSLCLFKEEDTLKPYSEYELNAAHNLTGNIWHIFIRGLTPCAIYGFKVDGKLLLDPYAKAIASFPTWNDRKDPHPYYPLGKAIGQQNFDWQGVTPPNIPMKDLIIYEMHVRGFTQDSSSKVGAPGTFLGLIDKIPYLKDLGINAVELMPIIEFNEKESLQVDPSSKKPLCNYS